MRMKNMFRVHFDKYHIAVSYDDFVRFQARKGHPDFHEFCKRLIKKYCTAPADMGNIQGMESFA